MKELAFKVSPFGKTGSTLVGEVSDLLARNEWNESMLLMSLLGQAEVLRLRRSLGEQADVDRLDKHIERAASASRAFCRQVEDKLEDFQTLFRKADFDSSVRRNLRQRMRGALVERRIARWQEAFETGTMSQHDVEMDRYRELKARRLDLEDTLKKVVPLRPPPYLYTEANIQRFQEDLKRIFLSGKTSITKNYLKFLVEEILVTDLRIDIKVKTRSALMLMSAEARNQESGTSEEAPEGVRTMVVPWLPLVDAFRTLCVAPTPKMRCVFEGLGAVAA